MIIRETHHASCGFIIVLPLRGNTPAGASECLFTSVHEHQCRLLAGSVARIMVQLGGSLPEVDEDASTE